MNRRPSGTPVLAVGRSSQGDGHLAMGPTGTTKSSKTND